MNLQRLFSIIRKETAQLLRDRRTLGTIITLPIIQMVLYGYLSNEVLHQPTAVWDQSQTAESRALGAAFENTRYFSGRYWAGNLEESERRLDAGQVKGGLVLQFTTTFLTIGAIVRERELGTLEQLVVTPIRPSELMLGKILPLIGLGYINLTFILLLAWAWFGVTVKGSILLLYLMTLAFFFSSLGIGTLLSTVARTFQQAAQLAQLVLLPSILISGFLFPRESLPKVLYWLGYAVPLTYFVTIIRGVLVKGIGFHYLYPQIIPLVFLGAVVFTLAIVRFQKKID